MAVAMFYNLIVVFFFSSRRRHTRCSRDWSSDVCSSDLARPRRRAEHLRVPRLHFSILLAEEVDVMEHDRQRLPPGLDRKSTRLNSSHGYISYAVFCLKKKKKTKSRLRQTLTTSSNRN